MKTDGYSLDVSVGEPNYRAVADMIDDDRFDEYANGEYGEYIEAYQEYLQEVDEHNAMVEAQPEPPEGAAYGIDAGDEEEPRERWSFAQWMNEEESEIVSGITYNEETERLEYFEYTIGFKGCPVNKLPLKGEDRQFMNYYVRVKLGQEPPAVAALPAAAQAAFNAASLLPLGNY
jgi:hypothetical protein